jgi:hypothetical protein
MSYINVGAWTRDGSRPQSKKAMKDALKADPTAIRFEGTAIHGPAFEGTADEIPIGVSLSVVGPDPFTSRRWYATVTRTATGSVKVA